MERAHSRLPTFALNPANTGAVAGICRKLEGIPLAIELAAARVTVLAVEQISARLGDSLGLLTVGDRTAAPRQQTLRATLEWSYELLNELEQTLFRRLSVFVGGWTLEATEAVGVGDGIEQSDILDLLGRLVDKSLVVAGEEGMARYRMLEPVRQYGREKLGESGETERIRERHARYYLVLAERAEPELTGPQQGAWLERLRSEHGNLRAALSWSLGPADTEREERAELALRMAAALWRFWNMHGFGEGGRWLEAALERGSGGPPHVRARALSGLGWITTFQGDYGRAVALLEESVALFKELGDRAGAAISLMHLGYAALHRGDTERAEALSGEAEALRRESLDRRADAYLLLFLGSVALDRRDYRRAKALLEESLTLFREVGDLRGITMGLLTLGLGTLDAGDRFERAAPLLEEGLSLAQGLGDKLGAAYYLLGMAAVAALRGQPVRASRLWGAAEALREVIGLPLSPFDRAHYDYERYLDIARSRLDEAAWTAAWEEGRAMTPERAAGYALGSGEAEPPRRPAGELTRREREIAALVARGLTNRQISAELVISEHTVDTHVHKILRKLGFRSRAQIAAWVVERRPLPQDFPE